MRRPDDKSRMSGDVHVRFRERLEGQFLRATRLVIGFQREDDARRVMDVLPKRFAKYGLEIHPEKSSLLSFGKGSPPSRFFHSWQHCQVTRSYGSSVIRVSTPL